MLYTADPFDRADQFRKDNVRIDELWSRHNTRVIPFADGKFWIDCPDSAGEKRVGIVTLDAAQHKGNSEHRIFLGLFNEVAWFALDYSNHPAAPALPVSASAQQLDLRTAGPLLSAHDGAILAYAQAILHWHRQSLFCQRCGHPNRVANAGHVKVCSNNDCAGETFPRTDAAVIMLVSDSSGPGPDKCLLGRSPNWPEGVYSTLAGFVEPGETLENAVRREVYEEAGVQVGKVEYLASQPWPFPQSMMLGFHARARTTSINIDCDELADAAWFSRADLAQFGNWGDKRFELQLPRADSISRHLINLWLARPETRSGAEPDTRSARQETQP